jgi:uncharacterized protein (TIGR01777 family)
MRPWLVDCGIDDQGVVVHVLITGATGFVGQALTQALLSDGHAVSCLTRSPHRAEAQLAGLTRAYGWTLGVPLDSAVMVGVDAVVHLAGETLSGRWTARKRRSVRDSRMGGTRTLVDAIIAAETPPRVLVSASGVGFYGERGDALVTEDTPPGDDFLSGLCEAWEAEAQRASKAQVRVALARLGIVIGPGGGPLAAMLTPFRLGAGGPMGSGRQWWSWVALEDAVRAIRRILVDTDLHGPVNIVSPEPIRQADFARRLGIAMARPAVLPVPSMPLRWVLGELATELLSSKRAVPERLTAAGFSFRRPGLTAALTAALGPAKPPGLGLPLLAAATLGLAPFSPEPHLLGKIRWIAGGGVGLGPLDGFDLLFHAAPWLWLAATLILRAGAVWTARGLQMSTEE